jgi:hypothetical protein
VSWQKNCEADLSPNLYRFCTANTAFAPYWPVLVTLAAAFVVRLRRPWARIAIRVIGSWIVASGLLMVGWAGRKG